MVMCAVKLLDVVLAAFALMLRLYFAIALDFMRRRVRGDACYHLLDEFLNAAHLRCCCYYRHFTPQACAW
jgi:hypothetical protein